MDAQTFNPDSWLQLGGVGAALFLLLVFVILYSRNFSNLTRRIDKMNENNAELIKAIAVNQTKSTGDHEHNISLLNQISFELMRMQNDVLDIKTSVSTLKTKSDSNC